MRTNLLLVLLFAAVGVLATIHILALEFSLYWLYQWLDIPMHALGGIIVPLFIFTLASIGFKISSQMLTFVGVLTIVLAVGLVWEAFEMWAGLTSFPSDTADTLLDLVMDVGGGVVGYYVSSQLRNF